MNATDSMRLSFEIVAGVGKFGSFCKIVVATLMRASLGQAENQSRAQQSTKEGNFLCRTLSASPTGLMQSTMCSKFLTRSTNVL